MRRAVLLFILCFFVGQAYSQFVRADYKKAAALKNRPLIVALFDLEEEPGTYCDSLHMAWYNSHIKEIFEAHWTLSDSIIYMRSKRVAKFIAIKSHDYVIFSVGPSREGQQSSGDVFWFPSYTFMMYLSEDGKKFESKMVDRGLYSEPLVPDMEMTGQLFRGKYIFKLSMADVCISKNDIVFALHQFNDKIREALRDKKPKGDIYGRKIPKEISITLKDKTLLLPEMLEEEKLSEEKIKRYYKHPFKILPQEEINAAIATNTANTVYLHYLWSDHERMFQGMLIDAENHVVLSVFRPGHIIFKSEKCPPAGTSYRERIQLSAKRLKSIK